MIISHCCRLKCIQYKVSALWCSFQFTRTDLTFCIFITWRQWHFKERQRKHRQTAQGRMWPPQPLVVRPARPNDLSFCSKKMLLPFLFLHPLMACNSTQQSFNVQSSLLTSIASFLREWCRNFEYNREKKFFFHEWPSLSKLLTWMFTFVYILLLTFSL